MKKRTAAFGEDHGRSVLKEHEVVRLRQEPDNARLRQRLLKKVTPSTLSSAETGRTWTHLNKLVKPVKRR